MAGIFIVDDDKYIRKLLSLELSEHGHEVTTAGSGRQVIEKIEVAQPDILIMEITLAHCDGVEMLHKIREHRPDLRVIICSAYDLYDYDLSAADYFITKSHDLTKLKTMIDRALEQRAPFLRDGGSISYSESEWD